MGVQWVSVTPLLTSPPKVLERGWTDLANADCTLQAPYGKGGVFAGDVSAFVKLAIGQSVDVQFSVQ